MVTGRLAGVTQSEAALAEELGRRLLELEYTNDGYIIDFLDTSILLEDRREERRRQQYLSILHYEYGYPKEQMRRQFPINIGSSIPIYADIAFFDQFNQPSRVIKGKYGSVWKSNLTTKPKAITNSFLMCFSNPQKAPCGPMLRQCDITAGLMTLVFHSGSSTGREIARATVQKESRPYSPRNGTASVNETAGSVTLSWGPGAARLGSNPDHYEVVIPDTSNPSTPLYSNLNVDDSTNPTTLTISNAWALGQERSHTAEVRHCNAAGGCSLPLNITITLPRLPTITANSSQLFIGQSLTMTASTPSADGSVSSYRWQEFTTGQWTNLTSIVSTQTVTSSMSGERIFRVVVNFSSGATKTSPSIRIEWRPIAVTVTASPDNLESGDANKRAVTLSATADAPSGVTYQWQQENGSRWTNYGTQSTSASKTVRFFTRGPRKFRVVVSHSVVPSAESAPTYVTWDELAIVSDMMTALHTAVTGDSTYVSAQTALINCTNADTTTSTFASFDYILADYTGETKAAMETGTCASRATTMFDIIQSLSSSKLAILKTSNSEYAKLLETPHGRNFEENLNFIEKFKQEAYRLASVIALDEAAGAAGGASGASSSTTHGFESCLPADDDTDPDLNQKFATLNCLQFGKAHSLWVALNGDQAKRTAFTADLDRYDWLQYDNFACSNSIIHDPARGVPCLKHDVSYASLQVFVPDMGIPNQTLDKAWNPRNKYLSDHLLLIDSICGYKVGTERRKCIPEAAANHSILKTLWHVNWWLAKATYFVVSEINDKDWPITEQDAAHAKQNFEYLSCDVPRVGDVVITYETGTTFRATWSIDQGCVQNITIHTFGLCFDVQFSSVFYDVITFGYYRGNRFCTNLEVGQSPVTFTVPTGTNSVTLKSVSIRPDNRVNDNLYYPSIIFTNKPPVYRN